MVWLTFIQNDNGRNAIIIMSGRMIRLMCLPRVRRTDEENGYIFFISATIFNRK